MPPSLPTSPSGGEPLRGQTCYLDRPLVAGRVFDLFLPEGRPIGGAVFFVHGGGWRSGTRSIFHRVIEALLPLGIACGSTDYRLDEARIAEQLADVRAAYAHFLLHLRHAAPALRPIVFGSSAGAQLALMLALAEPGSCGESLPHDPILRRLTASRPAGAAVVSPPLTMEPWDQIVPAIWNDIRRIMAVSYEADPQRYRDASPIAHVSAESPPVLLMLAENEDVFPRHQAEAFVRRMRDLGRSADIITYPQAEHGFFFDLTRRCQQHAFADLLRFIDQCAAAPADHRHERHISAL